MNWPIVELRYVVDVESGFGFPRETQGSRDREIPFYKVGDMNHPLNQIEMRHSDNTIDNATAVGLKAKVFPRGTVIFPKIGAAIATGKKRILSQPATFDNNVMGLVPTDLIDSRFLYYWALTFDFAQVANIGPVPSLRKSVVEALRLPLPPPSEQRRIAALLEKADTLQHKQVEAATLAARILPVLFARTFGDSIVNPNGWPVREFGSLIKGGPQNGIYKHSSAYGSGTPILRIDSFDDGALLVDIPVKRVQLSDGERSNYELRPGDIVINRVNSPEFLGKSALVNGFAEPTVFESNMMRLSVDTEIVHPVYVMNVLQTRAAKAFFLQRAKRAVNQASINQDDVQSLPVAVPPLSLQLGFVEMSNRVSSIVGRNHVAKEGLHNLFRIMLDRAFSGLLTAKWRQANMNDLRAEIDHQITLLKDRNISALA